MLALGLAGFLCLLRLKVHTAAVPTEKGGGRQSRPANWGLHAGSQAYSSLQNILGLSGRPMKHLLSVCLVP